MEISQYTPDREEKWLDCYMQAYFHSMYYDEMVQIKPRYDNPSIELIAIQNDKIIGFLDIEIEKEEGQFCYNEERRGRLVALLGVHPEFRQQGVATQLFNSAIDLARKKYEIQKLEIWIKEDSIIRHFLESLSFKRIKQFFQIYLTTDFFDKYIGAIPFDITPNLLVANIEKEGLEELTLEHAPEQTYPFGIYEKNL